MTQKEAHWPCSIDPGQYEQRSELTVEELHLVQDLSEMLQKKHSKFPRQDPPELVWLLQPLRDVLDWMQTQLRLRNATIRFFIHEIAMNQKTFWGWKDEDWIKFLSPREAPTRKDVNHHLMVVALILVGFSDFRKALVFRPELFARRIFGEELVAQSVEMVMNQLSDWGYTGQLMPMLVTRTVCYMLVKNQSPYLEDLTSETVDWMYAEGITESARPWVLRIARALAFMGIISRPVETKELDFAPQDPTLKDISDEWLEWCKRWQATTSVTGKTSKVAYYQLLKTGRWLTQHHPEITSPADWTHELAVEFVATLPKSKVGEYVSSIARVRKASMGKPLHPNSVKGWLSAMSLFFRDCQAWEWIPIRFDPLRWFATPRSVSRLIGPSPRIIADDIWAKLLWAGLNLTEEDIPQHHIRNQIYPLEIFRAVAIVWLFAGLRLNELARLRLGCIRWQYNGIHSKDAEQAICLLDVPVTKTSTAFTKPVAGVVGQAVDAWEAIRPEQPAFLDKKTGERVHYLFAYRGKPVGYHFVNQTVIPLICQKAGVPEHDARGKITSHRARATIATQLASTRQPMSLFELQHWLGHQSPHSTQWYVQMKPNKLTQAYTDAGYFDRNLRTISVLIDQESIRNGAAMNGEPWRYYDLGHGFCTYDFFDQCPHRMACAKCNFYLPKETLQAEWLQAKQNLQHMLQEIPLTDDEQRAVEDGVSAIETLQQKLLDTPTPSGQTPRQLLASNGFIPVQSISIKQVNSNKE